MSSVKTGPQNQAPAGVPLGDAHQKNLDDVSVSSQKLGEAAATGDAAQIKAANTQVKDAFGRVQKDGLSKGDLKNLNTQGHAEAVASFLGAQKKAGKPIDDKAAAATLHNDYDRYAKAKGLNAKSSDTFNKWKADITPKLQKAGLNDDDLSKSFTAAANFKFDGSLAFVRPDVKV